MPDNFAPCELPALPKAGESTGSSSLSKNFYENNGPLVINTDGTLSRIKNWAEMTPKERELCRITMAKRNKKRMEELENELEKPCADSVNDLNTILEHNPEH